MVKHRQSKISETMHAQKKHESCIKQDKEVRDNKSEKQLDKDLKDSFPASDPTALYELISNARQENRA